jgi:hypothetical protein
VADRISCGATRDYPTGQPSGAFLGSAPSYPLVITGGGALPLPISYCAQPAILLASFAPHLWSTTLLPISAQDTNCF